MPLEKRWVYSLLRASVAVASQQMLESSLCFAIPAIDQVPSSQIYLPVTYVVFSRDGCPNFTSSCCPWSHKLIQFHSLMFYFLIAFTVQSCKATSGAQPYSGNFPSPCCLSRQKMPQHEPKIFLELGELLNSLAGTGKNTQNVETDL